MKNMAQIMTTYSFIFLAAVALSSILGNILVVEGAGGPNITYVHSSCGPANTTKAGMRKSALKAIDAAVFAYQGPGEKASCSSTRPQEIVAAMCWGDISVQDCRNCLWNAQFRLVDYYCRNLFGGQLTLTNCYLRYEVYPFCS